MDPRKVPSALIDKPAPEFSLPQLHDPQKTVTKKDLLGKVYLLNVWASWCESCQYEHPFYVQLKSAGEKIFIVGYNYRDKRFAALQWLENLGDPYDVSVMDADGRTAIDFSVYGAPETFLMDKKGVIRHNVVGPVTPEIWKNELKPLIDKLEAQ